MNPTDDEIQSLLEAEEQATRGEWRDTSDAMRAGHLPRIIMAAGGTRFVAAVGERAVTGVGGGGITPHLAATIEGPRVADAAFIVRAKRIARPLAEEVLRLRKLLVDLDLWGINHKPLCNKSPWCACDCGADDLQLRINEATQ